MISDPYRWLEDFTSDEVKAWVEEQNKIADQFLKNPIQRKIKKDLEEIWETSDISIPFKKEDKIFLSTQKFIRENECSKNDRNLEFIFYEKFKNSEYEAPNFIFDKLGIWLLGYDGAIKDYSKDDKIYLSLFSLIDSMPMRKNEMINDKC